MLIKKITIVNIGLIEKEVIVFDKPLLLFYGAIRQGKSTILNAFRWVCGAPFPDDIIRHGQDEGSITLEFDRGLASRSWYRNKKGATTARDLTFIQNGRPAEKPASEIKRLMNPFMLDQDYLRNMGEAARKAYFAEMFAVDTAALDKEWVDNDRTASNLRIEVKAYGDIDLTPVERVDVTGLKSELEKIRAAYKAMADSHEREMAKDREKHNAAVEKAQRENGEIQNHNSVRLGRKQGVELADKEIAGLEQKLAEAKSMRETLINWLNDNPERKPKPLPVMAAYPAVAEPPDTSALEQKIQDAGATNVRADQFDKDKKRADEKKAKEEEIAKLEHRQRAIKSEKVALLKGVSETSGIKDLSFEEDGTFTYQGTQAGMLSTSQIMRLSSELSSLYPEGLGVELLDRAESLGASVFEYVDRAKEKKITILATIVGERPAKVPDDIGVFVVADGKITA
jgi:DNA repair exonuclease SbcCD ATPase subunit